MFICGFMFITCVFMFLTCILQFVIYVLKFKTCIDVNFLFFFFFFATVILYLQNTQKNLHRLKYSSLTPLTLQ